MPWDASDAHRHTHKATSRHLGHQWAVVANKIRREGGSEGKAIRIANAAVEKNAES